jgi:hypothetical protein
MHLTLNELVYITTPVIEGPPFRSLRREPFPNLVVFLFPFKFINALLLHNISLENQLGITISGTRSSRSRSGGLFGKIILVDRLACIPWAVVHQLIFSLRKRMGWRDIYLAMLLYADITIFKFQIAYWYLKSTWLIWSPSFLIALALTFI